MAKSEKKCFICGLTYDKDDLFTNKQYPDKEVCWTCYDRNAEDLLCCAVEERHGPICGKKAIELTRVEIFRLNSSPNVYGCLVEPNRPYTQYVMYSFCKEHAEIGALPLCLAGEHNWILGHKNRVCSSFLCHKY